jgi:hypothetical protein
MNENTGILDYGSEQRLKLDQVYAALPSALMPGAGVLNLAPCMTQLQIGSILFVAELLQESRQVAAFWVDDNPRCRRWGGVGVPVHSASDPHSTGVPEGVEDEMLYSGIQTNTRWYQVLPCLS